MDDSDIAGIPREGETPEEIFSSVDKELQEETPAESQTENKEDEVDLKKNDAWKELREERDRERVAREALEARLAALETSEKDEESSEKSEFVRSLVGDNEEVAKTWEKEKGSLKEEVKRELIQEQLDADRKAREQKEYWSKWTDERLSEVEKEFNVDFKSNEGKKNELSKIMIDYSPTDEAGNLDYRKGMKILNELSRVKEAEETQKIQVKKNVADATVSKETSVQKNKGFLTSQDLRGKDWRSVMNQD